MASRYWVGGNGTWDGSNTANWASVSGGSPGASAPTTSDTVFFDSLSGTGTCTTSTGATSAIVVLNSSTLGLTLGANFTITQAFNLTSGTLSLGSYTFTCLSFTSANTNVRSIAFGTGNITVTGNNTTIWEFSTITNFSYSGTSQVNFTYAGATGTRIINQGATGGNETNALNLYIKSGTDIVSTNTTAFIRTLDFTGFSGTFNANVRTLYGNLVLSSGMTLGTGTSTTTFAATSGTQQITTNGKTLDFPVTFNGVGGTFQLQDNCTIGSTRTVTLTNGTLDLNSKTLSCGLFNANNSNTRTIAFGTGNITLTGSGATIWNIGSAVGWTITGTPVVNCIYAGSTGTRTITNTSSITEAYQVSFNISAGSDTVVATSGFKSLDFTGFTGTLSAGGRTIYGNLTFGSGMTITGGSNTQTFGATSGTQTITTNGQTVDLPLTFNGVGGTWSFVDALTQGSTRAFTITNGTVKLKAGATSAVGAFATSGSNQKYLQSTTSGSQATLSQASGTVSVSNLTIQDINVTGGATWQAFLTSGNVNNKNNTGWDWFYQPGEYMYTRRKLKRLLIQ